MAQTSGYNLYSPWTKEAAPEFVEEYRQVERRALDLIADVYDKNRKAGKPAPFRVCAIHRQKGIHRWFNLEMSVPARGVRCEREYGGALNHAEALLDGPWRIGSDDEEKACEAKDEADRQTALATKNHELTAGMRAIGKELVQAMAPAIQAKGK